VTLPALYWPELAADYLAAYAIAFPSAGGIASEPSHRNAIILACSVAEHETNNGRAWPGTWNFGAVQLRALTLQEAYAYNAGQLKVGDFTPSRDGVLHVDTHPTANGPQPYPEWFAAFPNRVAGIVHFLHVLWQDSDCAPDALDATPFSVADAMYQRGYYEGRHSGARQVGKRSYPLTAPEQANVTDYANAVAACMATIGPALASWDYGRDQNVTTVDARELPTAPLPFYVADTLPPGPPDDEPA
jgi:hypothetical protein